VLLLLLLLLGRDAMAWGRQMALYHWAYGGTDASPARMRHALTPA